MAVSRSRLATLKTASWRPSRSPDEELEIPPGARGSWLERAGKEKRKIKAWIKRIPRRGKGGKGRRDDIAGRTEMADQKLRP